LNNLSEIQQYQGFKSLDFIAKSVVEGFITGLHKSPYHGFSVEFAEHRLYNTGESTRHIDWKLFARTDKLFVKKYEEETNLRCQLLIDVSSSMLFPYKENFNKLIFSIYTSAALITLLSKQRDAVGISLFDDEVTLQTATKVNASHIRFLLTRLQETLEINSLNKKTKVSQSLHQIAEFIHKRSLVVIFSDMFEHEDKDDLFNALQHLKHKKHEVIIYHVFDGKYEKNFEYDNRPYKFVDMESGEILKINPNKVRDTYTTKVQELIDEIKLKAGQFNIDFVEADINLDFKNILLQFLLKRQKMR
jgi:uncharacterized protein (DUF58 family)